jgi:hypothetical protein
MKQKLINKQANDKGMKMKTNNDKGGCSPKTNKDKDQ